MQHIHLDKTSSTQTHILSEFPHGPRHLVVSCEEQLSGFGRRGNKWDSFEQSICFSFTISPSKELSLSSIEISLLIVDFFRDQFKKNLQVKWPNDIMIGNKKCGGLIINNSNSDQLVVGIGLNISPIDNLPKYSIPASSVFGTRILFSKKNMAARIYRYCLDNRMSVDKIQRTWSEKCSHINQKVLIKEDEKELSGVFVGIGNQGQALIDISGEIVEKFSGSLRY